MIRMRNIKTAIAAAVLGVLAVSGSAQAELVYGLTNNNFFFSFDSATPGTIINGRAISGLNAGEQIVGIDTRPATGEIYAVVTGPSADRLAVLNTTPGFTFGATSNVANLSSPLNGTNFDIDFNPTVDRIRLVSDARQNLRVVPNASANPGVVGTVTTDGTLAYGPTDPNAAISPNIAGAAYTNNFNGATATTLYTIDATTNTLNIQNPPNNGTQVTVGGTGVDVTSLTGFDISGATGRAFAALQDGSNAFSQFYTLNLATGSAGAGTLIGGGLFVRDITVSIPEPATLGLVGAAVLGLAARRRRA